ncbi:MAG: hypothetical protein AAF684_12015, partial [Pseudomonadota bacterium]
MTAFAALSARGRAVALATATALFALDGVAQSITRDQIPDTALPDVFRPPPAAAPPLLLDFDLSVEAPAGILPPPEIADEIVTVTQIKVEGSTVYAREDLLIYFESIIG